MLDEGKERVCPACSGSGRCNDPNCGFCGGDGSRAAGPMTDAGVMAGTPEVEYVCPCKECSGTGQVAKTTLSTGNG